MSPVRRLLVLALALALCAPLGAADPAQAAHARRHQHAGHRTAPAGRVARRTARRAGHAGRVVSRSRRRPARRAPAPAHRAGGLPGPPALTPVAAPPAAPPQPSPAPAPPAVPPPAAPRALMVSAYDLANGTFAFGLSRPAVSAGTIAFSLVNRDFSPHELSVRSADGTVTHVADVSAGAGSATSATASLAPGAYTLFCALPGHEAAGMHATLTVVAGS